MNMLILLLCLLSLMQCNALEKLKLSSGYEIPIVGLGMGAIHEPDVVDSAISSALDNGYRHIDTAFAYRNHAAIGKTIRKWFDKGGKREDLFITSKLPYEAMKPVSVRYYLKRTLQDLGLDYVDMYLIHFPFGVKQGKYMFDIEKYGPDIPVEDVDHLAIWKEMEKQVRKGRVKSIGLSNFNVTQILNIYNHAKIKPSNLQVEFYAYLQQPALRKFCMEKNIVMTAYAPLGSQSARDWFHKGTAKQLPPLAQLPIVKKLAKKYNKSPSQILLRHTVQKGIVVVPKSANAARQKENISLFDFKLTDEEMKQLNALDKGECGRVYDFIAWVKDVDKNKNYPFGKCNLTT